MLNCKHNPLSSTTISNIPVDANLNVESIWVLSDKLSDVEVSTLTHEITDVCVKNGLGVARMIQSDPYHLKVTGRVGSLCQLLQTNLAYFVTKENVKYHATTTEHLTLPIASWEGKINAILGLNKVPYRRIKRSGATYSKGPQPTPTPGQYLPPQVATLYGFPSTTGHTATGSGQTIGFIEIGGGWLQSDLTSYFELNGIISPSTPNVVLASGTNNFYATYTSDTISQSGTTVTGVSGGFTSDMTGGNIQITGFATVNIVSYDSPTQLTVDAAQTFPPTTNFIITYVDPGSGETALDLEVVSTIVPSATLRVYIIPETTMDFFTSLYTTVVQAVTDGCNIVSISLGGDETQEPATVQQLENYLTAHPNVTVIAASGDSGSENGTPNYNVNFPACCPHVLSCGGTNLQPASATTIAQETVWNNTQDGTGGSGATGGGYSTIFTAPSTFSYQVGVPQFNPPVGLGRGVPDVSGNGDPYSGYSLIINGQQGGGEGGTSAVAPLWAALVAQLNELKGSNLGFMQSTLYANPSSLYDIVPIVGFPTNNSVNNPTQTEYPVTTGWDACTGLGSPNGQALYDLFVHCLDGSTLVLMADGTFKRIADIKRGDMVWSPNTNTNMKVSRVVKSSYEPERIANLCVFERSSIGEGLPIRETKMTDLHPIFYNGARRQAKCFQKFPGVKHHFGVEMRNVIEAKHNQDIGLMSCDLYDLQFDEEGSFVANGLPVMSRSPNHSLTPLPKEMYFNQKLYSDAKTHDSFHSTPMAYEIIEP